MRERSKTDWTTGEDSKPNDNTTGGDALESSSRRHEGSRHVLSMEEMIKRVKELTEEGKRKPCSIPDGLKVYIQSAIPEFATVRRRDYQ